MKEQLYDNGTLLLNYAEGPNNGKPLLLLHGGSSRWQTFQELLDELAEYWHVYAPDLRGHGKSDRARSYRIEDYALDIARFVKQKINTPTSIFGHSLGGMVGVLIAAKHPELVSSLIIGDSPLSVDILREHTTQQLEMMKQWKDWALNHSTNEIVVRLKNMPVPIPGKEESMPASQVFGEDHPWFHFMATSLSQNDPTMLEALISDFDRTYDAYDLDNLLPKIKCPVLIMRGSPEQGSLIRDADVDKAMRLIPNVSQIKIDNVGHALYMQDKIAVINAIKRFLSDEHL